MGKPEDDEFSLSTTAVTVEGASGSNVERGNFRFCSFIRPRCVLVLLLGLGVFLSALFWLPPFFKLSDPSDLDLDPRYRGHTIVASFQLPKPVSYVKDNVEQLEADVYYEFEAASTKVVILSLESSPGSNETDVVFGVDRVSKYSSISPAELSLIRASFQYLVLQQTNLQWKTSLFGQPSFFEVLKFPGGITVSPSEFAYPLQQVQIRFNFTLNNSILQIQENFKDLTNQLKSGLHLTDNENLYIRLANFRGSTVAPPVTVQTSVVLAVGIPSGSRQKQLARTIRDSPARNLGLNNTVFGKVKQVSLSSILGHPLNRDPSAPAPAPGPALSPHSHHHHHHHHHYHHHHQGHGAYFPPASAPSYSPIEAPPLPVKGSSAPQRSASAPEKSHQPVPLGAPAPVNSYPASPLGAPTPLKSYQPSPTGAPAPVKSYRARPSGCRFRYQRRHTGSSPEQAPTGAVDSPRISPHHSAVPPHPQAKPSNPAVHHISPSSPLPNVIYARVPPPSRSEMDPEPPDKMPSAAPSPYAGGHIPTAHWILSLLGALLLHHW